MQDHKPTKKDWLALAVLAVGLGLIVLDGTIVGVALPFILLGQRHGSDGCCGRVCPGVCFAALPG